MTNEQLAAEAQGWDERQVTPAGWEDAPDAVPRAGESVVVAIRLPRQLVAILEEFARREHIGYQALVKRWLDDRVVHECERLRAGQAT